MFNLAPELPVEVRPDGSLPDLGAAGQAARGGTRRGGASGEGQGGGSPEGQAAVCQMGCS